MTWIKGINFLYFFINRFQEDNIFDKFTENPLCLKCFIKHDGHWNIRLCMKYGKSGYPDLKVLSVIGKG
jgi:hypothetical protein